MIRFFSTAFVTLLVSANAFGQIAFLRLNIAYADAESLRITVILQNNEADGVSAMDFRLIYDPDVFNPIDVQPGEAVMAAGKVLLSNPALPGEHVVLIYGIGQETFYEGEVAHITFDVLKTPEAGASTIRLVQSNLARPDASSLPSRGDVLTIPFQTPDSEEDAPDSVPDESQTALEEEPEATASPDPPVPGGFAIRPRGAPRTMERARKVADSIPPAPPTPPPAMSDSTPSREALLDQLRMQMARLDELGGIIPETISPLAPPETAPPQTARVITPAPAAPSHPLPDPGQSNPSAGLSTVFQNPAAIVPRTPDMPSKKEPPAGASADDDSRRLRVAAAAAAAGILVLAGLFVVYRKFVS